MPVDVVDLLEAVEIEEQHRGAVWLDVEEHVRQRPAIVQGGERIAIGHPPQMLLRLPQVVVGGRQLALGPLGVGEDAAKRHEPLDARIERGRAGEKPADLALAWLLHNPLVTAPIIGPRTLEQLTGSLRALEIKLDKAAIKKLEEIFPGPGGEAPEAFAW